MSEEFPRTVRSGLLILLLHLPLIGYAAWVYPEMQPGQSITQLPAVHLLVLGLMLVLPYVLLARVVPGWNPGRSRLGEHED
jgi:hypothetical protein